MSAIFFTNHNLHILSGVGYNRKRAVKIKLPNRERKAV